MKKLNKVAVLLASLALAAPMALRAQTTPPGVTYQGDSGAAEGRADA